MHAVTFAVSLAFKLSQSIVRGGSIRVIVSERHATTFRRVLGSKGRQNDHCEGERQNAIWREVECRGCAGGLARICWHRRFSREPLLTAQGAPRPLEKHKVDQAFRHFPPFPSRPLILPQPSLIAFMKDIHQSPDQEERFYAF